MKRMRNLLFFATLFMAVSAAFAIATPKAAVETQADQSQGYPRNGNSGTVMMVDGHSQFFNTNEADLAVYCYNNSGSAWTGKISHRLFNDVLPVVLPKLNGNSTTWSHFIICRYNPGLEPSVNGFDGVYNKTGNIPFSNFLYAQNTVPILGYNTDGSLIYGSFYQTMQSGIKAENHIYLDLSGFPQWEEGGAKFAIYFAYPESGEHAGWGVSFNPDKYYVPSFCWKVQGQDNDHLYECIVPCAVSTSFRNIWSMVIAVRLDPAATSPNWDQKWNQTQDLSYNSMNQNASIIHVNDWNEAQFDNDNIISEETRVGFYAKYFKDTVKCSGTGASDATTAAMWNAVRDEYDYHLSRLNQGTVWLTHADEEGTEIEQAIARYDYIVFVKGYEHVDFINRAESEAMTYEMDMSHSLGHVDNTMTIVIAAVVLTLGASAAFILFRFRRTKKHGAE